MKYNNRQNNLISRFSSICLALALTVTMVLPLAVDDAYAAVDSSQSSGITSEETGVKAAQSEESGIKEAQPVTESKPETTTISNCPVSYNKGLKEALEITADIYPADGREVQLQRYNSADKTWSTVMTAKADQVQNAEETEETAEEATASGTQEAENAAEAQDAKNAAETQDTKNASGTQKAENTADTANTANPAAVHVSFSVPEEERAKTSSQWRIYVPATDTATEACSENIRVITQNLESPDMSAKAACIYRIDGDGKGTLIYSKNADEQRAQASTTKLMSAIVLLESGKIDSTTKISSYAARTPYASGRLAAGDVYKNRDLLYAMLLPSSNDAATAVAEGVGGSEAGFVSMMNAKAAEMGLTNTHFRNAHGLDADGHYTTAYELAKLTAYAYTFPEIRDCWATRYKTIKSVKRGRKWTCWSTNAIFSYVSNFLGGKTGTEGNAGCCFAGVYTSGGSAYVTVVLGSGYGFSRWSDTKKLHRYIDKYAASSY